MPAVPSFMLKKLYVRGSLKNTATGFKLTLKNILAPGTIIGLDSLKVDGYEVALENIRVRSGSGTDVAASAITTQSPVAFPLNSTATIQVVGEPLTSGCHDILIAVNTKEVGLLEIPVADSIAGCW
ncbi:MAG: hydroxymethylglutaryl-CoA reductase [Anaerolineae bacterium]